MLTALVIVRSCSILVTNLPRVLTITSLLSNELLGTRCLMIWLWDDIRLVVKVCVIAAVVNVLILKPCCCFS